MDSVIVLLNYVDKTEAASIQKPLSPENSPLTNPDQGFRPVAKISLKKKLDPLDQKIAGPGSELKHSKPGQGSSLNGGARMQGIIPGLIKTNLYPAVASQGAILEHADEMPRFIGGEAALGKYIVTHFRVPNNLEDVNIRIELYFVVDEQGKVTDVSVITGSSPNLNEEAVRVVSGMPDWIPGKTNGSKVKVRFRLPINIRVP